ncbi:import receptor subunit tom40 [Anaeramoeba ignava]|uniref:Import receptor subunit tom40 n=1 Tax=Anaeramoeba ignava TaxID=1746090 RepID=A0A9Q0R4H7_ANAIG|nr:import receptor subunit tom40 [Anaeramoeba ignava]
MGNQIKKTKESINQETKVEIPLENTFKLTNPGKFEQFCKESTQILNVETFDGFRLEVNQQMNQSFGLTHALSMGSLREEPSYTFGANYVQEKYALIGNRKGDGTVFARYIQQFGRKFLTTIYTQIAGKKQEDSEDTLGADLEYYGEDFTIQSKLKPNKAFGLSYLQSITPRFSAGMEFVYYHNMKTSAIIFASRYFTHNFIFTSSFSTFPVKHFSTNYVQKITPRVGLAAEFIYNIENGLSAMNVGYLYSLRQMRVGGQINSNGKISTLLEQMLHPLISFKLSAEIDYISNTYLFGYGLRVGPGV